MLIATAHLEHTGEILVTSRALEAFESNGITQEDIVKRHTSGDWGTITFEEKEQNNIAIRDGGPIVSAYHLAGDWVIWVVTAADRGKTVIFTPSESWEYSSLVFAGSH